MTTNTTNPSSPTEAKKTSLTDKAHASFEKGRDAVAEAAKSTADTVKKNPGTTAAVVAGAAAAIAGAAYGASKLMNKDKATTDTTKAKKPDSTKSSATTK